VTRTYDVAPDGRFVVMQVPPAPPPSLLVVLHLAATLDAAK
jgi:hypothetical protein